MKNKKLIAIATIILNGTYFLSQGQALSTKFQQNQTTGSSTQAVQLANYNSSFVIGDSVIKTKDLSLADEVKVLCVTVVSNNSTYIVWEPSRANNFASYNVYRKDASSGNYTLVKTIDDISSTRFSDDSVNTSANSYSYKVQTVNTSGLALPLNNLKEHCTINASANGVKGGIQINWNSYVGASVDSYSIYRVELSNNATVLVAKVPSDVLTIVDTTVYCPIEFSYRIKANRLNGNFISSSSDTSIAKPRTAISGKSSDNLLRSTVRNNNKVLTMWETPIGSVNPIAEYAIYRSSDNVNFSFLATVPSGEYNYVDNSTNRSSENYYYKIEAKDACGVTTKGGIENSSLLVRAKLVDGITELKWVKYEATNMGLNYYGNKKTQENESLSYSQRMEDSKSFQ